MNKSLYLIIYYITIALFASLACSSIWQSYVNVSQLQDGLSTNSYKATVHLPHQQMNTFIHQLKEQKQPFLLYRELGQSYGKEFYVYKRPFPLQTETLRQTARRVIVNPDFLQAGQSSIVVRQQQLVISEQLVAPKRYIHFNSDFFVELDETSPLTGTIIVDGRSLVQLQQLLPLNWQSLQPSLAERVKLIFQDQLKMLIVLALTIVLILLNTFHLSAEWVLSQRHRLYIHFLVGATEGQLFKRILVDYTKLVTACFAIGVLVAQCLITAKILPKLLTTLHGPGLLASYALCLVIGLLTCTIVVKWHRAHRFEEESR